MNLLRRLMVRAAREFAQNPEAREKASQVFQHDVKPRAQKAWREAQPEIANAKAGLKRFALKLQDEYRKGRDGR
ncbi:MAG TPA: hypothetical protein VML01_02340 [Bryobacterales bacterium]|nr:hypothetical protein [Bryobacterales bacterium]